MKMTLDEAIKERQKVIEVQEKLHEEASNNESKEIIKSATDNDRQLAEWLRELKEAKRLLKLAVEDFEAIGEVHASPTPTVSPKYGDYMRAINIRTRKWRYEDEALKLIGEDIKQKMRREAFEEYFSDNYVDDDLEE